MNKIKKAVHWLLFVLIALYLITGFGITDYRVEALTFGILSRDLSFRIHNILWIPFLILLTLHILLIDKWAEKILKKLKF